MTVEVAPPELDIDPVLVTGCPIRDILDLIKESVDVDLGIAKTHVCNK
jgi:hypothetical protein